MSPDPSSFSFTLDTTNPVAGTLAFDNLTDSGHADSTPITKDGTFDLSLSGDTDANGVDTVAYQVSTDGGANWSATTASQSDLADGSYQFRAVVSDNAGNSSNTAAISVIVDNTAPTAGTLAFDNLTDSGSTDTPPVTTDNAFDLSLSGDSDANGTSVAYEVSTDGGTTWSTTTAGQSGLADGDYQFHAVVTDSAGNSSTTDAIEVIVDTHAPITPVVASVEDDTGSSNSDGITDDTSLTIHGTGEENSTVQVFRDSTSLGTATANGSGDWSFADTNTLVNGTSYNYTANATDAAGNTSSASAAFTATVDTAAPRAPSVPDMTAASDSGSSNSDNITNDQTPTFAGTAEANSTINLFDGTTQIGTATADSNGFWNITSSALSEGHHVVRATAADAAGNVGPNSTGLLVTIDTNADTGIVAKLVASDPLINNAEKTSVSYALSGLDPDASAAVSFSDGTHTVTGNRSVNGSFDVDLSGLNDGTITSSVLITDTAGNTRSFNGSSIVLDTIGPSVSTPDLKVSSDTGLSSDNITSDTTPTFTGTAEAGALVTLFDDVTAIGSVRANSAGAWTITSSVLAEGSHTITAEASDRAGNSTTSGDLSVTIDTTAPGAGAGGGANPTVDEGSPNGVLVVDASADFSDADNLAYSIVGAVPLGSNGKTPIFALDTATGHITVASGGLIDFDANASYNVTIRATDGAGNFADHTYTIDVNDTSGSIITGAAGDDVFNFTHTPSGEYFITNENDQVDGGAGNDVISTFAGDDSLDGGAGADTMYGGQGNDTYYVDNTSDKTIENANEGSDIVNSSVDRTLGSNLENLTLTGTAAVGAGNTLDNIIAGNSGANTLVGNGGNDT